MCHGVCAMQRLCHTWLWHCIIVCLRLQRDGGTCRAGRGQAALPWPWSSSSTPVGNGIWDSLLLDALAQGAVAGPGSHPCREINIANCVLRLKLRLLRACVCCCIWAFKQAVQGHVWQCGEPAAFLKQAHPSPGAGEKSVAKLLHWDKAGLLQMPQRRWVLNSLQQPPCHSWKWAVERWVGETPACLCWGSPFA